MLRARTWSRRDHRWCKRTHYSYTCALFVWKSILLMAEAEHLLNSGHYYRFWRRITLFQLICNHHKKCTTSGGSIYCKQQNKDQLSPPSLACSLLSLLLSSASVLEFVLMLCCSLCERKNTDTTQQLVHTNASPKVVCCSVVCMFF